MFGKIATAVALLWLGWRVWRMVTAPQRPSRMDPVMVRELAEARALLGVDARADAATIRAAHRRLLTRSHPDRGGSVHRAQQLNRARDLLLKYYE